MLEKDLDAIAARLESNDPTFVYLNLTGKMIGGQGTRKLAAALAVNHTLRFLNLNQNHFGDMGAIALAQALAINPTLQILDIRWNCIGTKGAEALAKAIEINQSLNDLDVRHNDFDEAVMQRLEQGLAHNTALTRFKFQNERNVKETTLVACQANQELPKYFVGQVAQHRKVIVLMMMLYRVSSHDSPLASLPIEVLFHIFGFVAPHGEFALGSQGFHPTGYVAAVKASAHYSQQASVSRKKGYGLFNHLRQRYPQFLQKERERPPEVINFQAKMALVQVIEQFIAKRQSAKGWGSVRIGQEIAAYKVLLAQLEQDERCVQEVVMAWRQSEEEITLNSVTSFLWQYFLSTSKITVKAVLDEANPILRDELHQVVNPPFLTQFKSRDFHSFA